MIDQARAAPSVRPAPSPKATSPSVASVGQARRRLLSPAWARAGVTGMGATTAKTSTATTGTSAQRWMEGATSKPRRAAPSSEVTRKPMLQAPWQVFMMRAPDAASIRSASTLMAILVSEKPTPLTASSANMASGLSMTVISAALTITSGIITRMTSRGLKRSMMRLENRNMLSAPSGWPISTSPSWASFSPSSSCMSGMRVWMAPSAKACTKNSATIRQRIMGVKLTWDRDPSTGGCGRRPAGPA